MVKISFSPVIPSTVTFSSPSIIASSSMISVANGIGSFLDSVTVPPIPICTISSTGCLMMFSVVVVLAGVAGCCGTASNVSTILALALPIINNPVTSPATGLSSSLKVYVRVYAPFGWSMSFLRSPVLGSKRSPFGPFKLYLRNFTVFPPNAPVMII